MNEDDRPTWTGERFVPGLGGVIEAEHVHRYAFAMPFCSGRTVLDLASGEGYGSAMLASVASLVVGIDIAQHAVRDAARHYHRTRAHFAVATGHHLPFATAAFDVVVSFEAIEHIWSQEQLLDEIKRVLGAAGLLIISTPDKANYNTAPGSAPNPFHTRELSAEEFGGLLAARFRHVLLLGQQFTAGSMIRVQAREDRASAPFVFYQGSFASVRRPQGIPTPTFHLALVSERPLPSTGDSFLESADFASGLSPGWERLHSAYEERTAWARDLDRQLESTRATCARLNQECLERTEWARDLESQLELARHHLERLQAEHDERTCWTLELDQQLQQAHRRLETLQAELAERTEWATKLDRQLDAARTTWEGLNKEYEARTSWALELDRQLQQAHRRLEILQEKLAERIELATKLDCQLDAARTNWEGLHKEYEARTSWALELDRQLQQARRRREAIQEQEQTARPATGERSPRS